MIGQGGVGPVTGSTQGTIPQWHGIYYGSVSNNADPNKQNRCLLRIPQILGGAVTTWAVSMTPQQSPPKVGTLVAAMFLGGDLDYPAYHVVNPLLQVEGTDANVKPIGTVAHAGTSTKLAAADHVHGNISTLAADFQQDGTAAAGASGRVADAQHVHPQPTTLTVTNLTVTSLLQAGTVDAVSSLITPSGFAINSVNTPSTNSLPNDTNSGTGWVSGERAFMNNNWVANINSNFVNIIAALQSAGIFH